jgi:hypothetical protein
MTNENTLKETADATMTYRERSSVSIARADSTAQDGTVASFTRGNTLVVSSTTFYPVYPSANVLYIVQLEEQVLPQSPTGLVAG